MGLLGRLRSVPVQQLQCRPSVDFLGAYAVRWCGAVRAGACHRTRPLFSDVAQSAYCGVPCVLLGVRFAACQITYLFAIQNSNAGTATVIQYIGPVLVVLYLCAKGHRAPSKREVLAIILVVGGTYLLATHGNPATMVLTPAGLFWALISAVTYAMYSLIPRRLMLHYGSVPIVAGGLLLGGIIFSVGIQSWTVNPGFDLSGWLLLFVGLVFFGTIVGFTLYFQAVKDIGAAKTGLVASIETVSATLFAVLWLGTAFSWIDIVGFIFIMATVFVLAKHPGDGDLKPHNE